MDVYYNNDPFINNLSKLETQPANKNILPLTITVIAIITVIAVVYFQKTTRLEKNIDDLHEENAYLLGLL